MTSGVLKRWVSGAALSLAVTLAAGSLVQAQDRGHKDRDRGGDRGGQRADRGSARVQSQSRPQSENRVQSRPQFENRGPAPRERGNWQDRGGDRGGRVATPRVEQNDRWRGPEPRRNGVQGWGDGDRNRERDRVWDNEHHRWVYRGYYGGGYGYYGGPGYYGPGYYGPGYGGYYSNGYGYGSSWEAKGYHDGLDRGREDARSGRYPDPNNSEHFRDGNPAYRAGFAQGYRVGYGQYRGYGHY